MPRPKETLVHRSKGMLHNAPDVHAAAAHGLPNLEPDTDQGNGDVLTGNKGSSLGTTGKTGAVVEVVKPGEAAPAGTPSSGTASEDVNSSSSDAAAGTTGTTASGSQDDSATADSSKADNTQTTSTDSSQSQNQNQKESSSKKKGLKKLLPW